MWEKRKLSAKLEGEVDHPGIRHVQKKRRITQPERSRIASSGGNDLFVPLNSDSCLHPSPSRVHSIGVKAIWL